MKVKEIGEFGLIEKIAAIVEQADERVVLTIGDDTAVVRPSESALTLLTTDMLLEGVHFKLGSISPFQLGYKALAVNISDIAAMGGNPCYAVVSLALSPETDVSIVEDIYRGMAEIAREFKVSIVGGDVAKSDKMVINVALTGEVEEEHLCRRSDALAGDSIFVTGPLGASAAGLRLVLDPDLASKINDASSLLQAHYMPHPRVREGQALAKAGAHAMQDISDGLSSEIQHICEASDVGARIALSSIPITKGIQSIVTLTGERAIDLALSGGEDYELLFTAPNEILEFNNKDDENNMRINGIPVFKVGEIVKLENGIIAIDRNGSEKKLSEIIQSAGYTHF
jgi:thiamine-monophosphate kinase